MSCVRRAMSRQRQGKSTHFVEDVSMKALNDPLPPHHPASPSPSPTFASAFPYYKLDLCNHVFDQRDDEGQSGGKRSVEQPSRDDFMSMFEEVPVPELSLKTRHLLREVDKVTKFYQNRQVNELAFHLKDDIHSQKLSLKDAHPTTLSSESSPQPSSSRSTTIRPPKTAASTAGRKSPKKARTRLVANITQVQRISVAVQTSSTSPATCPKNNQACQTEPISKKAARPRTDFAAGAQVRRSAQTGAKAKVIAAARVDAEQQRPWRKNMKKPQADGINERPAVNPELDCKRDKRHDPMVLRRYIKAKRELQRAKEKEQLAAWASKKQAIKEQLLALDLSRRQNCPLRPKALPSEVNHASNEARLQVLLSELLDEMKHTYSGGLVLEDKGRPAPSLPSPPTRDDFGAQVEQLLHRHQQDLDLIKKCNLDINHCQPKIGAAKEPEQIRQQPSSSTRPVSRPTTIPSSSAAALDCVPTPDVRVAPAVSQDQLDARKKSTQNVARVIPEGGASHQQRQKQATQQDAARPGASQPHGTSTSVSVQQNVSLLLNPPQPWKQQQTASGHTPTDGSVTSVLSSKTSVSSRVMCSSELSSQPATAAPAAGPTRASDRRNTDKNQQPTPIFVVSPSDPQPQSRTDALFVRPDPFNVASSVKRKWFLVPETGEVQATVAPIDQAADSSSARETEVSDQMTILSAGVITPCSSIASSSLRGTEAHKDSVCSREAQFAPQALQLRFQAELNQLEGIQEAERQITHIQTVHSVVTARQEAASLVAMLRDCQIAAAAAPTNPPVSSAPGPQAKRKRSKESRAEFEARMKLQLHELLDAKMLNLFQQQTEATKATAEAARHLRAVLETRSVRDEKGPSSRDGISSDMIRIMVGKAQSQFISTLEAAKQSDKSSSVQKTISEAIQQLSTDDTSTSSSFLTNVTGEIAAELSSSNSSSCSSRSSTQTKTESYSAFANNIFLHNVREQQVRSQEQFSILRAKERLLAQRTSIELNKIEDEKRASEDPLSLQRLEARAKRVVGLHHERRNELRHARRALHAANKERSFLLNQHKHIAAGGTTAFPAAGASSVSPAMKQPLSPKLKAQRRHRHSSAESDDSINVTTSVSSDHSDLEIRMSALQEELKSRMLTAAKLKKHQDMKQPDQLRAQEESLKQQIQSYNNLILQKQAELEQLSLQDVFTPPQIKVPRPLSRANTIAASCTITAKSTVDSPKLSDNRSSPQVCSSAPHPPDKQIKTQNMDPVCEGIMTELINDTVNTVSKAIQIAERRSTRIVDVVDRTNEPHLLQPASDRSDSRLESDTTLHVTPGDDGAVDVSGGLIIEDDRLDLDSFGDGDYIDDDFGLSLKQESEKLWQQQLLIEQEIDRIHQEKKDKPPPPYTPPSSSALSLSPRLLKFCSKPEPPMLVPSNREKLSLYIPHIVHNRLLAEPAHRWYPTELTWSSELPSLPPDSDCPFRNKYLDFLRDLVSDLMDSTFSCLMAVQNPIWLPQKPLRKLRLALPRTSDELVAKVSAEVLVLLNLERRAQKELLAVRWSHKKRDRVDQILVRELHAEEPGWVDYSTDEVTVKDMISCSLMDELISDTAAAVAKAMLLKIKPTPV